MTLNQYNPNHKVNVVNNLYKVYLIGSMESPGKDDEGIGWRQELTPLLNSRGIYCFDPTKEETQKVGMPTAQLIEKLNGWQLSGNWDKFIEYMDKVWKGVTKIEEDVNTHEARMTHLMGDIDYVEHSDFLIWHLHEDDKLGGTIIELALAWKAGIPCYLVTTMPKSKINKSILYFLLTSGHGKGRIFKNFSELVSYLDGEYNLHERVIDE